jgi:hypothetical protein
MRFVLAAAVALACLVSASFSAGIARADAPNVSDADRAAIRQVIEGQIAAFRRDDAPGAFAYAAPTIQHMFGTPDVFLNMVRTGYAAVYRPREVEFRALVEDESGPVQQVLVVGPDGVPVLALYAMQRQADGSWRINGCTLSKADDTAA